MVNCIYVVVWPCDEVCEPISVCLDELGLGRRTEDHEIEDRAFNER